MRVAVVGCGAWGKNHVRTHAAIGSLAAVVDPVPAVAEAHAATYGVEARTFEEVLDDASIDGVVIAAPAADHARLAEAALAAGKHVFVEKPLCIRPEELAEIARCVDELGDRCPVLMAGYNRRFAPATARLTRTTSSDSGTTSVCGENRPCHPRAWSRRVTVAASAPS